MKESHDERISKEIKRLKKLFAEIPRDLMSTVISLINNAAFMSITLEDLQEAIIKKGVVDIYVHGTNQTGTKKTPEVDIYNSMIKNQMQIMKQLVDLLPAQENVKKKDQLLEFLKK